MSQALDIGTRLYAVAAQEGSSGECFYARVGCNGCIGIEVNHLPGPMGWYLVAVIHHHDAPDKIMPLHMAEMIEVWAQEAA